MNFFSLTLLHSEQPKLYGVLAILSAIGLKVDPSERFHHPRNHKGSHKLCQPLQKMVEKIWRCISLSENDWNHINLRLCSYQFACTVNLVLDKLQLNWLKLVAKKQTTKITSAELKNDLSKLYHTEKSKTRGQTV